MDFNIVHSGMVGFLALLATLLISLAVMIYDRTSDNSKFRILPLKDSNNDEKNLKSDIDDTFPWEKTVILKQVAMAPWLFAAFVLASLCLIFIGFYCLWIQLVFASIYFLCAIFICTRIWKLGKWLYSQANISTSETYRQKMKYKFLRALSSDSDIISTWSVTWNNISINNPYQAEYLRIYLEQADTISDNISTWSFIEAFLQNAKSGNINILRPDIQKLLLQYSLDALRNDPEDKDKIHIKLHKKRIIETLIELSIYKDESTLGYTFNLLNDYLAKHNSSAEIMYNFAILFFATIDKTKIDNDQVERVFLMFPHTEYGISNLLNNEKERRKEYSRIWLIAFVGWFKNNYISDFCKNESERNDRDKRIDCIIKAFFGFGYFTQISERLFGDFLVFYGLTGWVVDEGEKTVEDSWVRIFANSQRLFMSFDLCTTGIDYIEGESDEDREKRMLTVMDLQSKAKDNNTITILKYIFPYLSNNEHIKNVMDSIKTYRRKINSTEDVRLPRLNRLEEDFKTVKSYNQSNKE